MSEFRQDPITKNWVLLAPNRARRPEQYASASTMPRDTGEVDPQCVFCPGNESKNIEIARFPNDPNWEVRVIPNKFEALSHQPISRHSEFYVSRSGSGDHEVVITRKHNEPIALQSVQTVELSLNVFKERINDLSTHHRLSYISIFHNHGRDAGASLIHPHYQILATPIIPHTVHEELVGCYHYFQNNGSCIYCDITKEERRFKERVIFETEEFFVVAPYASRIPFETLILPKQHASNFEEMDKNQITQLAYILKMTLGQLYIKLNDPPLNFYVHTMPLNASQHIIHEKRSFHWHMTIFPRLAIWAGFEYATGIPVNPVTPEMAAQFLK